VAVVTSRNRLTGLLAAEGAHSVTLDVLPEDEARDLLSRRLGAGRTAAEPEAVRDIIAACARLPLALAITAAQAGQTSFPLAVIAAELARAGDRLDALDTGDPAVQVRAVFSWSYAALTPEAGRLFRLLGLHPGPDVSAAVAASLAGHDLSRTRRLLAELTNATLLVEHVPGRYACHDLLHAYAAELTGLHDSGTDRRAATIRLLDHYLHTAYAADRLLFPARDPIEVPLTTAAAGTRPEAFADHRRAMTWFGAEHPVLLAATRLAGESGHDARAWQLAWSLDTFLYRRGHWHDRVALWTGVIPAADRLGDLDVRAYAHRTLARTSISLGRSDDAHHHLHLALGLSVGSGNQASQANTHNTLAFLANSRNDYRQGVADSRQALALYRAVGNLRGQAAALSGLGWSNDLLGDYPEAIDYCRQALEVLEKVGDRRAEADVWDSLGYAHHHLGDHTEAAECYQQALDRVQEDGDRFAEAEILVHLGDSRAAASDPEAAGGAWSAALHILTELDHADAKPVRAKLETLGRNV
jgi:tetratricopeptide (TPR) repeat protein